MGEAESLKYACFLPTTCPDTVIPGDKEDQMVQGRYVFPFSQLRMTDVDRVGGKNASLGELLSQLTDAGIRVPDGFATTAEAFRLFLKEGGLEDRIAARLEVLDVDDVNELAKAGAEIRSWVEAAPFPAELEKEIREFYDWLKGGQEEISVAVRSSAIGGVGAPLRRPSSSRQMLDPCSARNRATRSCTTA